MSIANPEAMVAVILLLRKAAYKAYRLSRDTFFRVRNNVLPSYGRSANQSSPSRASSIPLPATDLTKPEQDAIDALLAHDFEFLGSGPFKADLPPGSPMPVNPANRREAQRIAELLSPDYQRIDWHRDPRSGHHWRPDTWQGAIQYGVAGEEILLPWTLSRMQHLPFLARCWAASPAGDQRDRLLAEFQNQILDFMAANPPRWGVNWASPMDASIRAINWLVAYDIFAAGDADFSTAFLTVFSSSLRDHGRYIFQFREWHPVLRNNHYLSDLVGLLFISAHLPQSAHTRHWLAFSARGFIQELFRQFHPDGSNFEASTCYHMLSSELVTLGLAILFNLPQKERESLQRVFQTKAIDTFLPQDVFDRLSQIRHFMLDTISPEGTALQIGDNDSGRILKLQPLFWESRSSEQPVRNFSALQQQLDALVTHFPQWNQMSQPVSQNAPLASVICAGLGDHSQKAPTESHPSAWAAYPGLGLYLYRNELYRLSIRCGPVGQSGFGGHAHNDQLSITLHIKGHPVIVDPGTYCYTSDPQTRMAFRSTANHNTLSLAGQEQNTISPPEKMVFRMLDRTQAAGEVTEDQTFIGRHWGYELPHTRTVQPQPDRITIQDNLALSGEKEIHFHLSPEVEKISIMADNHWAISGPGFGLKIKLEGIGQSALRPYNYSLEYGQLQVAKELVFFAQAQDIRFILDIAGV